MLRVHFSKSESLCWSLGPHVGGLGAHFGDLGFVLMVFGPFWGSGGPSWLQVGNTVAILAQACEIVAFSP